MSRVAKFVRPTTRNIFKYIFNIFNRIIFFGIVIFLDNFETWEMLAGENIDGNAFYQLLNVFYASIMSKSL